jgi:hypothetical protein
MFLFYFFRLGWTIPIVPELDDLTVGKHYYCKIIQISVVDPHWFWFQSGSGSSIFVNADPAPDPGIKNSNLLLPRPL